MASTVSNPFEIRGRALSSRKRVVIDDDDEEVSETETKLITRKRAKVTSPATTLNSGLKFTWSKKDELRILEGIAKYEAATKSSYDSDYGALYEFIEPSIEADFTRTQLRRKIWKLKMRFQDNLAKSAPSFVDCDENDMFKLSLVIWAKPISQIAKEQIIEHADKGKDLMDVEVTQTLEQCDYMEQAEVEHDQTLDHQEVTQLVDHDETVDHEQNQQTVEQVTQLVEHDETVDHEQNQQTVEQVTQLVEHDQTVDNEQNQQTVEQLTETTEQEQATLTVEQADDSPPVENEHITETLERAGVDIGEEERKKVGAEELCLLQEALEELVFPTSGEVHQKFLLQNLKNLEAEEGKQLTEEWKALVVEEIELKIKKMRYAAKLGDAIVSG